jgi:hypothetical protein
MADFWWEQETIGDYLRDRLGCKFLKAVPNWEENSLCLVFDRWDKYQAAVDRAFEIGAGVRRVLGLEFLDLVFAPPRKVNYQQVWELGGFPPSVEYGAWDKYQWNPVDCDMRPEKFSLFC